MINNIMKKNIFSYLYPLTTFFFLADIAFAVVSKYEFPLSNATVTTIPDFLILLVDLVFLIAVPLIVIFIIYAGFLFVTAGDNESQIAKARMVFLWTVVGAAVVLGAKAISKMISDTILAL